MIDQALQFVVERLNDHFGVDPPVVVSGSAVVDQGAPSASSGYPVDKIIISVANIRLDPSFREYPKAVAPQPDAAPVHGYGSTLPCIEILLMLSAGSSPGQYALSLRRISQIISFFNSEPVFSAGSHPGLRSAGIRKLSLSYQPLTIEEVCRIWSINGGKYLPSIFYNMKIDLNSTGHAV